MRTSNSSERLGLRALVLASAIVSASACAPAPMDAGNPSSKGGSSGSGSGGSGGTTTSGSGGTTSGSGGTTTSGSGGSAPSGSGGSGQSASGGMMGARTGGTTGNPGTGGTTMMGTGGTTMPRPDAGMETGGAGDTAAPAAVTFTMVYSTYIGPTCGMCHSMATAANHKGVVLASKASALMTMKAVPNTIVAGNAAMSNLVKLLQNMGTGTAKKMPPNGTATAAQIKLVSDWINAGALDN